MKIRRLLSIFAVLLCLTLIAGACGKQEEETATVQTGVPSQTFGGEMIEFFNNKIVVKSTADIREFSVSGNTEYVLGNAKYLEIGDSVEVIFHDEGAVSYADKVTVTKHEEPVLTFTGILVAQAEGYLLITGEETTIVIEYDSKTTITGNISLGDLVEVSYSGDLSEDPYAISVKVISENISPEILYAYGIVSEKDDTSFVLSVDSADASRFQITKDTMITGMASDIKVGDSVAVAFRVTEGKTPEALSVDVIVAADRKEATIYKINGTAGSVSRDSFTLQTKNGHYKIRIDSATKFSGEKFENGAVCEVTYTGNLADMPLALTVYCSKAAPAPEPPTEKPTEKPTEAPTEKPTEKPTEAPTEKPTEKPTEAPTEKPTEKPTEAPTESPTEKPTEDPTESPTEKPTEAPTESPTEKPTEAPTESPTEKPTETPTESPTEKPTEEPTESPTEEPTEEPTESPTEESTEDPTEEPTDPPSPKIEVVANGLITDWSDKCIVEIDTGKEIELAISDDLEIASGYFPKEGDIIEFRYVPDDMVMTGISLRSRKDDAQLGWVTDFSAGNCKILLITGEEKEYVFDETTDILIGYTPQKDDFVYIKTDKEETRLDIIRFLSHPEDIDDSELFISVKKLAEERSRSGSEESENGEMQENDTQESEENESKS